MLNMPVLFYCTLLILGTLYNNPLAKSVYDENVFLRQQNEAQEEKADLLDDSNPDALKYKRASVQNDYQPYGAFSNPSEEGNLDPRSAYYRVKKSNFPYGIVYSNGRPLGILEPLPRQYRTADDDLDNLQLNYKPRERMVNVAYPSGGSPEDLPQEAPPQTMNDNSKNNAKRSSQEPEPKSEEAKEAIQNKDNQDLSKRESRKLKHNSDESFEEQKQRQIARIKASRGALARIGPSEKDTESIPVLSKQSNARDEKDVRKQEIGKRDSDSKSDKGKKENQKHEQNDKDFFGNKGETNKRLVSIDDEHLEKLKETLNQMKNPSPSVQRKLRDLLVEMGLAEKEKSDEELSPKSEVPFKRSAYNEDENLEGKENAIGLVKVRDGDNGRLKRSNSAEKEGDGVLVEGSESIQLPGLERRNAKTTETVDSSKPKSNIDKKEVNKKSLSAIKSAENTKTTEPLETGRSKRGDPAPDPSAIVKNVEGELTISGNKSPLASSGKVVTTTKQSTSPSALTSDRLSYQERIERDIEKNIQAKIDAIKEEVLKEIEVLERARKTRKKRQASSNLINEETPEINPDLNIDYKLQPQIRQRREGEDERSVGNDVSNQGNGARRRHLNEYVPPEQDREGSTENDVQTKLEGLPSTQKQKSNQETKTKKLEETAQNLTNLTEQDEEIERRKREARPQVPYWDNDDYEMEGEGDEFEKGGIQRKRQTDHDYVEQVKSYVGNVDMEPSASNYVNDRHRRYATTKEKQKEETLRNEVRNKRDTDKTGLSEAKEMKRQQISDMSDTDLFGALPQKYVGELARVKRVKRQQPL